MQPVTLGLLALAGYGLFSKGKRYDRTVRKRPASTFPARPTPEPKTPLSIADDCSSWEMPDLWILQTAEPRFRKLLNEALETTRGDIQLAKEEGLLDPVGLTYAVLHGETGPCPEPMLHQPDGVTLSFRELQSEIPQHPNYYPHPAVLGLFDTIYEAVEAALAIVEQTGSPERALLFPV